MTDATFRLAFRIDGKFWRVYYAPNLGTMDGALELGSIRTNMIDGDNELTKRFKALFMDCANRAVADVFGTEAKIATWNEARAPARERQDQGAPLDHRYQPGAHGVCKRCGLESGRHGGT